MEAVGGRGAEMGNHSGGERAGNGPAGGERDEGVVDNLKESATGKFETVFRFSVESRQPTRVHQSSGFMPIFLP